MMAKALDGASSSLSPSDGQLSLSNSSNCVEECTLLGSLKHQKCFEAGVFPSKFDFYFEVSVF